MKAIRSAYFLGIGGSGMLPLARFANRRKIRVAGSDPQFHPETMAALGLEGIKVYKNSDLLRIKNYDMVVYSSAIGKDHPEMRAALQAEAEGRLALLHRMEFLNLCFAECRLLFAVAGTHGKTTTASMLAWLLCHLGLDPDVVVGGRPHDMPEGYRIGRGDIGVYETDESDGSFLKSSANLRLLLNIDRDHLDHYGDFETLVQAFEEFLKKGRLVTVNLNDPALAKIVSRLSQQSASSELSPQSALSAPSKRPISSKHSAPSELSSALPSSVEADGHLQVIGYAIKKEIDDEKSSNGDGREGGATKVRRSAWEKDRKKGETIDDLPIAPSYSGYFLDQSDRLEVRQKGRRAGVIALKTAGRAAAENALAVLATAAEAHKRGYIQIPDFHLSSLVKILNQFPGVERRLELIGTIGGAVVYDDYGHHPTAIEAALLALKGKLKKGGTLTVLFQPHRYGRTQLLYHRFAQALLAADRVFLLPIYSAGEKAIEGVDSELIYNALIELDRDKPVFLIKETEMEVPFKDVGKGDIVLGSGAGSISQLLRRFLHC